MRYVRATAAAAWGLRQVAEAQRLLPMPSETLWMRSSRGSVPFLFFRPGPTGAFAVYDPTVGTASAESEEPSAERLVAAVAARLGYPPGVVEAAGPASVTLAG